MMMTAALVADFYGKNRFIDMSGAATLFSER